MSDITRLFAYVWAAPNSLVGLLLGLVALALGAKARVNSGTLEIIGGLLGCAVIRLPRPYQFAAITLGHVILAVSHEMLLSLRDHEHVHVRQYERWGILFLPAYLLSSLWQTLRGRRAYTANYFERQAYQQAGHRTKIDLNKPPPA